MRAWPVDGNASRCTSKSSRATSTSTWSAEREAWLGRLAVPGSHAPPPPKSKSKRRAPSGRCAYCPAPAQSWDHVVPKSAGGSNAQANLVPACLRCNGEKGSMMPDEWAAWLYSKDDPRVEGARAVCPPPFRYWER